MRILTLFIISFLGSLLSATGMVDVAQPTAVEKTVTVEIRYYAPEAGVVDFVFGINGWQPLPEELIKNVSIDDDGFMFLPMRREEDNFVAELTVPVGAIVQYGFKIFETADGESIDVWDTGKDPERASSTIPPILIATYDKKFYVDSAINLGQSFVQQTFHYLYPNAGNVVLVWGINGWQNVPEAVSEDETTVEEGLMRTQMVPSGDFYRATIQVPQGSTIQYGFLLTTPELPIDTDPIWDGDENYSVLANIDGFVEINSPYAPTPTPSEDSAFVETESQNDPLQTDPDSSSLTGLPLIASLFSKHWPLLLIGICMVLGIFIGFRNT